MFPLYENNLPTSLTRNTLQVTRNDRFFFFLNNFYSNSVKTLFLFFTRYFPWKCAAAAPCGSFTVDYSAVNESARTAKRSKSFPIAGVLGAKAVSWFVFWRQRATSDNSPQVVCADHLLARAPEYERGRRAADHKAARPNRYCRRPARYDRSHRTNSTR